MKPIGLVTCYFHHNYGSMLQAYATEMIFQKMNLPYQTISCKSPIVYMQGNKLLYIIKKILIADWKMRIGKIKIEYYKKKYPDSFGRNVDLRNACFDRFSQEYFHLSPYCKNREELKAMANNYSAFVVGSDQLWRTDSVEHGYYTLEWVPDNICKIAYSTSLGIKKVPWFQRKKNRWFMKRFNYMALREKSACDLVYKLIGREIQVVLDPTLLFTGEQWMHIQQEKPLTNGKYIFCYLLGNNPQQRLFISEVQKRTGLKIVALQHLDEYIPSDEGFANETQKSNVQKVVEQDGCMMLQSAIPSTRRADFFRDLNNLPFDRLQAKYFPLTLTRKIIIKMKPFFYHIGIFSIYMKLKKML